MLVELEAQAGVQAEESPRCRELGNLGAQHPARLQCFLAVVCQIPTSLRCSCLEAAAGIFSASLSSLVLLCSLLSLIFCCPSMHLLLTWA